MERSDFVPFAITVCGVDELQGYCEARVSHVLSILDPGSEPPPAFGSFGEHERLDLRFHDIIDPEPERTLPEATDVERLLAFGRDLAAEPGARLLVHCQMGISRSTASMALILAQARPDRPAAEALAEVVRIRPRAWPNLRIVELGDAQLGLGGALVRAAHARYRVVAEKSPHVAEFMVENGRTREVPGYVP